MAQLRAEVIQKLKKKRDYCIKLSESLNVPLFDVMYNLYRNDENNMLTKNKALKCIKNLLGVKRKDQLLYFTTKLPSFEKMRAEVVSDEPEPCTNDIVKVETVETVETENIENVDEKLYPKVFTFAPSNQPIRIENINGEPWFVAKDVCDALGIINNRNATNRLDDEDKKDGVRIMDAMDVTRYATVINESGLYNLIFQSRRIEAKLFKRWVTSEVLPAIRRTGEYQIRRKRNHNCPIPKNTDVAELLRLINENLQKNDQKTVAAQLGVSAVSVSTTLSGKTKSHVILQALYEKALENKRNGFVNAYSPDFVTTAIAKLKSE
ncbi:MAG: Bro-N domain-containing protein [Prevotellaceae bacterium]|jgi:prophage antirepressor-like protein|nr:Bro-N domain-containing protein [Prevotellaceae bacterium]